MPYSYVYHLIVTPLMPRLGRYLMLPLAVNVPCGICTTYTTAGPELLAVGGIQTKPGHLHSTKMPQALARQHNSGAQPEYGETSSKHDYRLQTLLHEGSNQPTPSIQLQDHPVSLPSTSLTSGMTCNTSPTTTRPAKAHRYSTE